MRKILWASLMFIASTLDASTSESQIAFITELVKDFNANCETESWQLWPVPLCGPLLFVDPGTRQVWANQPDLNDKLVYEGSLYSGRLPDDVLIANTAQHWSGVDWSMVMLPLVQEQNQALALIAHESWHRIQNELHLPATGADNSHLSEFWGRYLLLLEFRALTAALLADAQARESHINNALFLRHQRYLEYENAQEQERLLELNEGLAEYTGIRVADFQDRHSYVANQLKNAENQLESVERSFAYFTGPAYGLLLDLKSPDWLNQVNQDFSFSNQLMAYLHTEAQPDLTTISDLYDGEALLQAEKARHIEEAQKVSALKRSLIGSPVLTLPLINMRMSFDPNNVVSIPPHGKAYDPLTVKDIWGVIEVSDYALITSDFKQLNVPIDGLALDATSNPIQHSNWTLTLNPGWQLRSKGEGFLVEQTKPDD